MTFSMKLRVPLADEVCAGLTIDQDSSLASARGALQAATSARDAGKRRLQMANDTLESTRRAVLEGREPAARLEAALRERDTAGREATVHEGAVSAAAARIPAAENAARDAVIAEAGRRRDELQAIADRVAPVLAQLRDCEAALDTALHAVRPWTRVPALEWPQTLADQWGHTRSHALAR